MKTPLLKNPAAQFALICSMALLPTLQGQTTPAAPATDEDTIILSPFVVSTNKDVGYLAGNTLAGSRLNTSLKDTGAAISVLTSEFLKDIGATNMKDVIQFQNNAVPDVGDAALSVNGNPMIGNDEWQLRIRGLAASYSRNFFKWEASSDFYNVDRIDQSRGPNSILFGFGAPGGLVNTSTKQAKLYEGVNELAFTVGSWSRYRGSFDVNHVLIPQKFAMRVNAVAENTKSWREFEFDNSRRAHLALKYQPSKTTTFRLEGEIGKVDDNVARPWLAIDQSFLWRAAGRPTKGIAGTGGDWNPPAGGAYIWDSHMIVGDDGVVRNWVNHAVGSNNADSNKSAAYLDIGQSDSWAAPTWSAWSDTPANNALIPLTTNTGGPDAVRQTKYSTVSAYLETIVNKDLTLEFALNHQSIDFLGYDPDGSRATNYYGNSTEIWGAASSTLPDIWGNAAGANPTAGKLYVENNWTRRTQNITATDVRATLAYNFKTGSWGKHRAAGLLGFNERSFDRLEECEVFSNISGWPFNAAKAEADVNRLYRRHYFTGGDAQDIHVQSWRVAVPEPPGFRLKSQKTPMPARPPAWQPCKASFSMTSSSPSWACAPIR